MIKFFENGKDVLYCFVDNTRSYDSAWAREIIKNISDYTISNLHHKGLSLVQSENEDEMLHYAASKGYRNALVFTTGTEFINGNSFFTLITELSSTDYFIYGHILDRNEAYYELHHQCYLINIEKYKTLGMPSIGGNVLGDCDNFIEPVRSSENVHDDYTPLWIKAGTFLKQYKHKLHGWNIINRGLTHGYGIDTWTENARRHKVHYYPENAKLFNVKINEIYKKYSHCQSNFIHTTNTEEINVLPIYKQIVTPASSDWWKSVVKQDTEIILYDYNLKSIDYWKNNTAGFDVKFIHCDLLTDNLIEHIDDKSTTFVNLSNIFSYEGTAAFHSVEHRLARENYYLNNLKEATVFVTGSASAGFTDKQTATIRDLKKPTWHIGEWNYYE
jgi:hypothetical protein